MAETKFIKVKGRANDRVKFPLNASGEICLKDIQVIFKGAVSLTYEDDEGDRVVVRVGDDGLLKLQPSVSQDYEVFYDEQVTDKKKDTSFTFATAAEKRRFQAVLNKVEKKKFDAITHDFNSSEDDMNSVYAPRRSKDRIIKVDVTWKHRSNENEDYVAVNKALGGNAEIELKQNKKYSYSEIKDLAVSKLKTPLNANFFLMSNIKIGTCSGKEFIFKDKNGEECDFWTFKKSLNYAGNKRFKLYVLTTAIKKTSEDEVDFKLSDRPSQEGFSSDFMMSTRTKKNHSKAILGLNFKNVRGNIPVNDKSKIENKLKIKNNVSNKVITHASSKIVNNSIIHKKTTLFKAPLPLVGKDSLKQAASKIKSILNENKTNNNNETCASKTNVKISTAENSTGTKKNSCSKDNVSNAVNMINKKRKSNNDQENNNYVAYKTYKDAYGKQKVQLVPRKILSNYDTDAVNMFQLHAPLINKKEIKFTQKILGKGSFGVVTEAIFRDTKVAVKGIDLETNNKYILREIAGLSTVRHPNIILLMGVAEGLTQIWIIMEFFEGHNLRRLLYWKEIKRQYQINFYSKVSVAYQLCSAVSFLHQMKPFPIIHEDIKPENIIVNKHFQLKLCDLGLAKFYNMPQDWHSTQGNFCKGTDLYMAPELLQNQAPASVDSDIWAVGCVLYEIFVEKYLWNLPSDAHKKFEELKKIFKAKQSPDLKLLPDYFIERVSQCFFYDGKRCSASALVLLFTPDFQANS